MYAGTNMYASTNICIYTYMYIHICIHTCIYTYMYIYIHVYIHIYICIFIQKMSYKRVYVIIHLWEVDSRYYCAMHLKSSNSARFASKYLYEERSEFPTVV